MIKDNFFLLLNRKNFIFFLEKKENALIKIIFKQKLWVTNKVAMEWIKIKNKPPLIANTILEPPIESCRLILYSILPQKNYGRKLNF